MCNVLCDFVIMKTFELILIQTLVLTTSLYMMSLGEIMTFSEIYQEFSNIFILNEISLETVFEKKEILYLKK